MSVVATAGHVDHGKSSLVLALTGTDPDRFEEEKRRGLTIDLGFAHSQLPSGATISFIDVPGHVRFLRNMLAGVGGVDACLFVVAATEGWKPQSEEHLRILELLGIRHGIVALTKIDLVDDDWLELATLDVSEHLEGTFLDGCPIIPVSATTGVGLGELQAGLDELLRTVPTSADRQRPRLWIDRVFAARGSGTVVTGTLTGGAVSVDDRLVVNGHRGEVRVRAIQSLGRSMTTVAPGNRVALNLSGVDHGILSRGDAVICGDQWRPTRRFDAEFQVLAHVGHDVSRRGAYVAYVGSGEFQAKVRILGSEVLHPGDTGLIRVHLDRELPLLPGDRFVLRESGRNETVGGGEVLDIAPVRPASKAAPDRSVDRVIRERGWVSVDELELLTGQRLAPMVGRWIADPIAVEAAIANLEQAIESAGPLGLDIAGLDERHRDVLATMPTVTVDQGRARKGEVRDPLADHPIVQRLAAEGLTPGDVDGDKNVLRELLRRGLIVQREGITFHPSAIDKAAQVAAQLLASDPAGFTVAQFRDATSTTRKHALPLVSELDSRGVTRRRGDLRIGGPRLPSAAG